MDIRIRQMEERDLDEVDRIMRLAFGTFLGLPDPMQMFGDTDMARTRYRAAPEAALAAEAEGRVVGSNFATRWGSFGFFGPLSVEPQLWNQKVAQQLLERTVDLFDQWKCTHTGLFTFSHSPKHAALYQKFGFWSRFLTPIMSKDTSLRVDDSSYIRFSELRPNQKAEAIQECRKSAGQIYEGLDITIDIEAADIQHLGDTVLKFDGSKLKSFAVCHIGPGSEAESGECYVKFGCVTPGPGAQSDFENLLRICESYAVRRGMRQFTTGVNMARHEAYQTMVALKFRTGLQGVAMQRGFEPAFNHPGAYVLDDWR